MARPKTSDPKGDSLREHGTLNTKAEDVRDPLFASRAFFDARDLVQVKYEMLRRVHVDGDSVVASVARFGLSRPTFYKAQQDLSDSGIAGLLPDKRGPRGGHKLTPEVLDFIEEKVRKDDGLKATQIAELVEKRFARTVHARTVERALAQRKKKLREP